jgi:membrane-bound serine protease (ClpP class)
MSLRAEKRTGLPLLPAFALFVVATAVFSARPCHAEEAEAPRRDSVNDQLLQTYVEGSINRASVESLMQNVDRWTREERGIKFIVFEIDTSGGDAAAAHDLARYISNDLKAYTTIAFIPRGKRAVDEGVLVALAAKVLAMGPGSQIGAATRDRSPKDERTNQLRSWIRTYASDRGYPESLADTMVAGAPEDILSVRLSRPDVTRFYTRTDYDNLAPEEKLRRVGEPTLVVKKGDVLLLDETRARDYGFAKYIAADLTELRAEMRLRLGDENVLNARRGQLKSSNPTGQTLVDFLNKPLPRFLLLLCGCLCVLIELKAFGTLVPGLLGFTCFVVFFVSSLMPVTGSLAGTATLPEVLIFVLGIGLLGVEVFLLPGMGIFAVTGGALCLVSLVLAMVPSDGTGLESGLTVEGAIGIMAFGFGAGTVCFLALIRFLPHNPIFTRKGLISHSAIVGVPTADSAQAAQKEAQKLLGAQGVALTTLRPSGKMETDDGRLLDVLAEGEFIEKGTRVRVMECPDGQILVTRLRDEEPKDKASRE